MCVAGHSTYKSEVVALQKKELVTVRSVTSAHFVLPNAEGKDEASQRNDPWHRHIGPLGEYLQASIVDRIPNKEDDHLEWCLCLHPYIHGNELAHQTKGLKIRLRIEYTFHVKDDYQKCKDVQPSFAHIVEHATLSSWIEA